MMLLPSTLNGPSLLTAMAATLLFASAFSSAQDAPAEREHVGMPQINVIDKLLSAEQALSVSLGHVRDGRIDDAAWSVEYLRLYAKFKENASLAKFEESSRVRVAMALGVKASDGVLALKAKSIEDLNDCAEQIEKLAGRLEVEERYLAKANVVKMHASKGQWLEAFMNLAWLEFEVRLALEKDPSKRDEALLVIAGGWIQGGRVVTDLILENYEMGGGNYRVHVSNLLREPHLIALLLAEMERMEPGTKDDEVVKKIMEFLPQAREKVNVGIHEKIPREDVEWLRGKFEELSKLLMSP